MWHGVMFAFPNFKVRAVRHLCLPCVVVVHWQAVIGLHKRVSDQPEHLIEV